MDAKKVLVFGAHSSSKGDALRRICSKLIKTVSMEYGTAVIDNTKIHFFSPAADEKFSFMNAVLSKNLDGVIIFLDNAQKLNRTQIDSMKDVMEDTPYIVFTNNNNPPIPKFNNTNSTHIIFNEKNRISTIDNGFKTLLKMMTSANPCIR
jgi:uncharacterized protein